ncbi:response regulator [Ornithinibacillus gellani]|uniref:response regulator n=1 Tax=Ornithinibacillus gellani TaxID=2293253 RepID=UPI000F4845A9|nr:response regulator [Ornithinibacillus gellani]TQS72138.1 response regulator [Ornithinibacillus gellani]
MTKELLVVDDQQGIRMLIQELFSGEGYHVTTAKTGKEALEILRKHTIDLIIMDYQLPVMNGLEVLHIMEQEERYIPTILISGMLEDIQRKIVAFSFVATTLSKPFNVVDLSLAAKCALEIKA